MHGSLNNHQFRCLPSINLDLVLLNSNTVLPPPSSPLPLASPSPFPPHPFHHSPPPFPLPRGTPPPPLAHLGPPSWHADSLLQTMCPSPFSPCHPLSLLSFLLISYASLVPFDALLIPMASPPSLIPV
jgi:hypothetical protein